MPEQQTTDKVNRHYLFVKETVYRRYEVDLPAGVSAFTQASQAQDIVRERIAAGDRGTLGEPHVTGPQWDFASTPRDSA